MLDSMITRDPATLATHKRTLSSDLMPPEATASQFSSVLFPLLVERDVLAKTETESAYAVGALKPMSTEDWLKTRDQAFAHKNAYSRLRKSKREMESSREDLI